MFGKHNDYHGTRNYRADKPKPVGSELGLRTSLVVAWLKLQFEKFWRSIARTSTSTWLLRGDEKHFTVLGSPAAKRSRERPITDIFPVPGSEERRAAERKRRR